MTTTFFLRTKMHKDTVEDGGTYMVALFFTVTVAMFNGISELNMPIMKLPVFYKQRDLLFYPAWAYSIPPWILKIPITLIEVFIWEAITYYAIGYDSSFVRQEVITSKIIKVTEPLTSIDISSSASDGSKVRVAYQGLPGAYSEDADLKAYPKCETVPCDEFEAAFKAVELWLVDRAVLPIKNYVDGSIHRNYDLLLRHRLHIVGEVKLRVNHS